MTGYTRPVVVDLGGSLIAHGQPREPVVPVSTMLAALARLEGLLAARPTKGRSMSDDDYGEVLAAIGEGKFRLDWCVKSGLPCDASGADCCGDRRRFEAVSLSHVEDCLRQRPRGPVATTPEGVSITFDPPTQPNWDTYNAVPTTEAAINVVRALAVVPTVNGGVQFELHVGGHDIEIEYDAKGYLEGVLVTPVLVDA